MSNNLGIVICENFIEEIQFLVKNINLKDIFISPFSIKYDDTYSVQEDSLMNAIKQCEEKCTKIIIIIENSYSVYLKKYTFNNEKYKICTLESYFDLFINKNVVSNFIDKNYHLITSGWLKNLEKNNINFKFIKSRTKLMLLDTGICENSLKKLQELSEYLYMPYDSLFIGLDFFSMFIENNLLKWKLECETTEKILHCNSIEDISSISFLHNKKKINLEEKFWFVEKKKEQLFHIIDSIYEGVFIMDSNYEILFVNKGVGRLLGIDNIKSILGKNVFDIGIISKDYHDIILNRFKYVINNNSSVPLMEEELLKLDGSTLTVNIYSEAIEYEGSTCILSVIRDISEHKKSEDLKLKIQEQSELLDKAAEYDKLKTEFFANLSHEFRTPLNVMLSTLQLLNLLGTNESVMENEAKITRYYNIMKQNCYRLLRLVNNLIDITKIEANYFNINFKNEDIVAIIEDITLSVTDYAKNKGLNIIFDTNIEEKIIACDADKIERIILNLLSNAIKFTPDCGTILVTITDKNSTLSVSVRDTGVGIPKDKQLSIFKRFIQVDKSLSRNREGSGIGLSLVKSLVELHNGKINLISEDGKGSEFIIEFPTEILPENDVLNLDENLAKESKIDRISIEFSDIYD